MNSSETKLLNKDGGGGGSWFLLNIHTEVDLHHHNTIWNRLVCVIVLQRK